MFGLFHFILIHSFLIPERQQRETSFAGIYHSFFHFLVPAFHTEEQRHGDKRQPLSSRIHFPAKWSKQYSKLRLK